LAQSIGDAVARSTDIHVTLYRMSLTSRGTGLVGQMTTLLSGAFASVLEAARKTKGASKHRGAHLLLIDEADALAQTRESAQMHHEDRAGVNALIRGIDELSQERLPTAVIMCTNRLSAIDPGVRRRAAEILEFDRPGEKHRRQILSTALSAAKFKPDQIEKLVAAMGESPRSPGFTYSDILQRFLPSLVVDAYPHDAITFERASEILSAMQPTPKFTES
jgi:AAA+ superfamily predicted ATPase